jgi:CelD/BcsL family acetyltransferase involved in cellulose biosynthesis
MTSTHLIPNRTEVNCVTISTLCDTEQFGRIRSHWEKWQSHPNADLDHFGLVCRLRREVKHPYVMVVEQAAQPCALLLARLEKVRFAPGIGYLKPLGIRSNMLAVLHQGCLGLVDDEIAAVMVRHLYSWLVAGNADGVTFNLLRSDSPLWRALMTHGPQWWCEKNPRATEHRALTLRGDPGFLLQQMRSKHRSWIRRKQRELESAFAGKLTWRWLADFEDVAQLCGQLDLVAARTYQRGLSAGFINDEEHRQRCQLFASRRQLRVQLLEMDGTLQAFWIGIVYDGVFHSWATGYAPELREYELGTLVLLRMVDELVREGVQTLDFGRGDAFYKQRFGDRCWREATVHLFAPTAKGMLLRSSLALCGMLEGAGRQLARGTGILERLKTKWRQRLAPASSRGEGAEG